MRIHGDWATPGFALPPVAGATGPFPLRPLLEAWWRHRADPGDELMLVEDDSALLPVRRRATVVSFLGEPDLTDYHAPLGTGVPELVAEFVSGLESGTLLDFDSLPAEASDAMVKGLHQAGIDGVVEQHEVSAVLRLPDSFDEYLARLGKKDRHELRRKRRRFESVLGMPRLLSVHGEEALQSFVAMHRLASGDKGTFMTPEMTAYFRVLLERAEGRIHLLYGDGPAPVAAAFGFEDVDGYYLYNSAYDPEVRDASPGIVLLAVLIETAIVDGKRIFDFLKGDEPYKFRHGARPRPLFSIAGRVP